MQQEGLANRKYGLRQLNDMLLSRADFLSFLLPECKNHSYIQVKRPVSGGLCGCADKYHIDFPAYPVDDSEEEPGLTGNYNRVNVDDLSSNHDDLYLHDDVNNNFAQHPI